MKAVYVGQDPHEVKAVLENHMILAFGEDSLAPLTPRRVMYVLNADYRRACKLIKAAGLILCGQPNYPN